MKSVKIIFSLAAVALIGALICFMAVLFAPEKKNVQPNMPAEQAQTVEPQNDENAEYREEAEAEIKRFKDTYGVEISIAEMIEQLKIREDYEETYGMSYELEEVFLAEVTEGHTVGDPGDDEMDETIAMIQEYVKRYNIDESRYAAMTVEEELEALKLEYGPLDVTEPAIDSEATVNQEVTEEEMTTEPADDGDGSFSPEELSDAEAEEETE